MSDSAKVKKPFTANGKTYAIGDIVTEENLGSLWNPFLVHGRIDKIGTRKPMQKSPTIVSSPQTVSEDE